jgi:hypothetical protein
MLVLLILIFLPLSLALDPGTPDYSLVPPISNMLV